MLSSVLLALLLSLTPPRDTQEIEYGYASAYAPGVFREVVYHRLENRLWRNIPPSRWIYADGYVAVMDCSRVGEMAVMVVDEQRYDVLIADCAGADGPIDRFEKMGVILEMDWELWERHKAHGVPLRVGLSR